MAVDRTGSIELERDTFDSVEWNNEQLKRAADQEEARQHAGHASNGHGISVITERNKEEAALASKNGQGRVSPSTVTNELEAFNNFLQPTYYEPLPTIMDFRQDYLFQDHNYWQNYSGGNLSFGLDDDGNFSNSIAAMHTIDGIHLSFGDDGSTTVVNGNGVELDSSTIAHVEAEAEVCVIPPGGIGGGFPDDWQAGFEEHYDGMRAQLADIRKQYESGDLKWNNIPPKVREAIEQDYAATHDISAEEAGKILAEDGAIYTDENSAALAASLDKYEEINVDGMENMHRIQAEAPLDMDNLLPPTADSESDLLPPAAATDPELVASGDTTTGVNTFTSKDPSVIGDDTLTSQSEFSAASTEVAEAGHDFQNAKPAQDVAQEAAPETAPTTDTDSTYTPPPQYAQNTYTSAM